MMRLMEIIVEKEGMTFLAGARCRSGRKVLAAGRGEPASIWQLFVKRPRGRAGLDFDAALRGARCSSIGHGAYICAFSARTIVYKA
jgi:glutamate synthase domain-containing protein 1